MVYLISAPVTGQRAFFSFQSKDTENFPCNFREDVFSEGCLDAPDYIVSGITIGFRERFAGSLSGQAGFVRREQ